MIKILIADDHPIYRKGLKQLLEDSFDSALLDEAGSSSETLKKINKNDYHVLLLDIAMPGRSGLDIIKEIRMLKPKLSILMLSAYPEEQYAIRALKSGASGYLTKKSAADELIEAIKKVSQGGKYLTSTLAESLAFAIEEDTKNLPHENLSDREFQVMCMIAAGKAVKEISDELKLAETTVRTYRTRIFEKMNMKKDSEVIHYAVKHGLVD